MYTGEYILTSVWFPLSLPWFLILISFPRGGGGRESKIILPLMYMHIVNDYKCILHTYMYIEHDTCFKIKFWQAEQGIKNYTINRYSDRDKLGSNSGKGQQSVFRQGQAGFEFGKRSTIGFQTGTSRVRIREKVNCYPNKKSSLYFVLRSLPHLNKNITVIHA